MVDAEFLASLERMGVSRVREAVEHHDFNLLSQQIEAVDWLNRKADHLARSLLLWAFAIYLVATLFVCVLTYRALSNM